MKSVVWLPSSCALLLVLTGCTNHNSTAGNDPLGTGPFDKYGRYREDWADDPSKWSRPGKRQDSQTDELPFVAQNDQPPANANPLAPKSSSPPKTIAKVETTPRESSHPKSTSSPKTTPAKPKPKPVVKAKPKPKTTRYVVKKGDSLSRIASRMGSSVSAIQRANGIKGTLIRPGQSLVIPKR